MSKSNEIHAPKIDRAIQQVRENACMINSCCTNEELKNFNGDFAHYLICQLEIRKKQIAQHEAK